MIEVSPDMQLENLQPSRKRQGPIAQEPPRRSERIYAKLHPPAPARPYYSVNGQARGNYWN